MSSSNATKNTPAGTSEPALSSINAPSGSLSTVDSQSSPKPHNPTILSTSASDTQDLFNRVQTVLSTYLTSSPLYKILLSTLSLSSAAHGHVTLELVVLPVHVNSKAVLHGSLSATLVDLVGGLAIASTGSKTGLSTDMHISFAGSASEGDTLRIEGFAERVGATLAFTRVRIGKEVREGEQMLVATGSHTKYVR
ncbi:4HBT domain-containing protein [Mycena sanguinolenta]|uniref:4HBT domain-containing protein n=1 Tax=Mycena sanguinolenta TaxID=230812 RepID=A0A8H7CV68_9AGAR|nr:4HBT domain-containing protein [Mycena sanguinolenta]